MKNTFKLMGLALLASAMMFTACKDDKEDEENNTPTPKISVNFKGSAWTSESAMDFSARTEAFDVYKSDDADASSMQFKCGRTNGTYGLADNSNFVVYWDDDDTEYATSSPDGSIVVTDININGKTISAVISATFVLNEHNFPLAASLKDANWIDVE